MMRDRGHYRVRSVSGYLDRQTADYRLRIAGAAKEFPELAEVKRIFLGVPVALPPADLVSAYVVLIGAPFTAGWGTNYSGVDNAEWLVGPKRARQQSECYGCCIQDFDLDIFETLEVLDYGDADIAPEASYVATVGIILAAVRTR